MTKHKVTFIVYTEEDPSTILDCAQGIIPDLIDSIGGYDESVYISENDVSVEEL